MRAEAQKINKEKIKAIIFDFVGVLLVKKSNYKPDQIIDEIDRLIGHVTNDKAFKRQVRMKYNLSEKEFKIILQKIINKYEKFKPLWSLLPKFRKKYKLAIINNGTGLTLKSFKNKYKTKESFDLFLSSAELGIKKPDKRIFLKSCKILKVKPAECLFIDDSKVNIIGAEKVGMKILFWDKSNLNLAIISRLAAN